MARRQHHHRERWPTTQNDQEAKKNMFRRMRLVLLGLLITFLSGPTAGVQSSGKDKFVYLPAVMTVSASDIAGCPIFPSNNVWNTRIDTLPVHPYSAQIIASAGLGATTNLHPDFSSKLWNGGPVGIPYNVVSGSQKKVPISFFWYEESDPGPYPIPADVAIEGGPNSTGDRHVLIVDRDACKLYEIYDAYPQSNGSWTGGSGAIFDLRSNALRPSTWTSADASGLPILPGLVRYDEVAGGEIRHALRFSALYTRKEFVWPARHQSGNTTTCTYCPAMGQRFRLKASYDITGFDPQMQVILRALKTYGLIVADNGMAWSITGVPDSRWNTDITHQIDVLTGGDFEAVDGTQLMVSPDSGEARLP
jgi:hypothetical protein